MKGKGFRQIDNEFFLAIMAARLEGNAYQVLLAVIHFTLGYDQRDTAAISHKAFRELTRLSRNAVRRALSSLIRQGLISKVSPETNRQAAIYRVNVDWRGQVDLPSGGVAGEPPTSKPPLSKTLSAGKSEGSQVNPPSVAGEPSRGSAATPATVPLKKTLKKTSKEKNDHLDPEVGALSEKIIDYYFEAYQEHTGEPHPDLKTKQRRRVIAELAAFSAEYGMSDLHQVRIIVDYHFQRKLETDYNINHFATPGILKNLYFTKLYYGAGYEAN